MPESAPLAEILDTRPDEERVRAIQQHLDARDATIVSNAFARVYGPTALLAAFLAYPALGPKGTALWLGAYAAYLLARRELRRRLVAERHGGVFPMWLVYLFGGGNALLLGLLGPLSFAALTPLRFMMLSMLASAAAVFVSVGGTPWRDRLPRVYYVLLLLPYALAWLLRPEPEGWVMSLYAGAVVLACETISAFREKASLERARLSEANERLAAQLQQQIDALDSLNASKTRLLAAACHDLRQPAHAMGMWIDARIASEPDARERTWLELLQRSSSTLVAMLSNLMDLTRLSSGNLQAQRLPVALEPLLEEVRTQFELAASRKGLALHVDRTAAVAITDPYLLRRVAFNLVSNAVKYTPAGEVALTIEQRADAIVLTVRDTGVGIAASHQARVFDEYTRLDRSGDGLGIGLSVVRLVCELLGHALTLRSVPDVGTEVTVCMPAAAEAVLTTSPTPVAVEPGAARRAGALVAMAEDDPDSRNAAQRLLESWGYEVVAAETLDALMARLRATPRAPALLMSDFHMPGRSGFELVRAVRDLPGLGGLPALMLTGDLDAVVSTEARALDVLLLHKPVSSARLRDAIAQLLEPG